MFLDNNFAHKCFYLLSPNTIDMSHYKLVVRQNESESNTNRNKHTCKWFDPFPNDKF